MELRVLGPLQVLHNGVPLSLGPPKQRVVLAMLAVNDGQAVSLDALVEELWGERPPESAVPHVRGYAAALRRVVRQVEPDRELIARAGSGYRLDVEPGELDLAEFEQDVREGRRARAADDLTSARLHLEQAGARWRGRMLDGVPLGPTLSARCSGVEQERSAAVDCLAEVYLRQGQPDLAIAMLQQQVQADPLREQPYALLMRARYRIDGVSGALEVYDAARKVLAEQLGVEPGEELQRLHRAVLNRDPDLAPERAAPPAATPKVPRELRAQAPCFVGRQAEMATVRAALAPVDEAVRGRPAVVVLYGPGGVGKSALAVRAGHELAQRYPDGQLHIDLLGVTPGLRPVSPVEALGRLLRGVGLNPAEVPSSEEDAAARWRTVTADRRLLVVLDNAADARQVGSLIPAAGACGVLLTSRQPLSSIDADERIRLAGLSDTEGFKLLTGLASRRPVDATDAGRIVGACGNLPLAVRIAAGRLASRPDLSAREYAERLSDGQRRLDELQLDGLAVRACIRTGYDALVSSADPVAHRAAQAFRALGLLNVPDVAPGVVAAMLNEQDIEQARAALDHLVYVQLLEPAGRGRYRLHDLVRLVAIECAVDEDPEPFRDHTLYRAVAYYTCVLLRAEHRLRPGRVLIFGVPPAPNGFILPKFEESAEARAWIDAELLSIASALEQSGILGDEAGRMALWAGQTVWNNLDIRHDRLTAERFAKLCLADARRRADVEMAALAHLLLGRGEANAGRYDAALRPLRQALSLMRECQNRPGIALTLNALGMVTEWSGRPEASLPFYHEALEEAIDSESLSVQAAVLQNMSSTHVLCGSFQQAMDAVRQSERIRRELNDLSGVGSTLINASVIHCLRGDHAEAVRCTNEALAWCRESGDGVREREALIVRSEARLRRGEQDAALADIVEVRAQARAVGDRYAEAVALRQHARILTAENRWKDAARMRALAIEADAHLVARRDPLIEVLLSQTEPTWRDGPG